MQAGVVEWVTSDIRRIVAPNPSPMTGPGTNTYLLGRGTDVVIIDPGPAIEAHLTAVLGALDVRSRVTAIVVTHAHKDHSAGAARLANLTGAPVCAFGDARSGRSALMQRLAEAGTVDSLEGTDPQFAPDRCVADGCVLPCADSGLRVIHTPGHMGGHICLGFGDVLFSGDHAMGWASSVVSPPEGDMGAYMASLERLMQTGWRLMLPGHGAAVPQVAARLEALWTHRRQREADIRAALAAGPATPQTLTRQIYQDTAPQLLGAAQRNVLAHLIDLYERNLVHCAGLPGADTIFTRSDP